MFYLLNPPLIANYLNASMATEKLKSGEIYRTEMRKLKLDIQTHSPHSFFCFFGLPVTHTAPAVTVSLYLIVSLSLDYVAIACSTFLLKWFRPGLLMHFLEIFFKNLVVFQIWCDLVVTCSKKTTKLNRGLKWRLKQVQIVLEVDSSLSIRGRCRVRLELAVRQWLSTFSGMSPVK